MFELPSYVLAWFYKISERLHEKLSDTCKFYGFLNEENFLKPHEFQLGMFDCLKQSSLRVFDEMITYDSIPLTSNIKLTRNYHEGRTKFESKRSDQHDVASMANVSWSDHILTNMLNLFRTHTLKIDFTQSAVSGRGLDNI